MRVECIVVEGSVPFIDGVQERVEKYIEEEKGTCLGSVVGIDISSFVLLIRNSERVIRFDLVPEGVEIEDLK